MRTIVVGVDGSAPSGAAIRWAYDEAVLRRARLHLVSAWTAPQQVYTALDLVSIPPQERELYESAAQERLQSTAEAVLGEHPDVDVVLAPVEGGAAQVLLDTAADVHADLLVVGS